MASPLAISISRPPERSADSFRATLGGSPESEGNEKGDDDMRPLASFMPSAKVEHGSLHDLMSARVWRNHAIWRAGVSAVANPCHCIVTVFDFR